MNFLMLYQLNSFFRKKKDWFERFVDLKEINKAKFKENITDIKKIEKNLKFEISKNQDIIEYSPLSFKYLKDICSMIKKK